MNITLFNKKFKVSTLLNNHLGLMESNKRGYLSKYITQFHQRINHLNNLKCDKDLKNFYLKTLKLFYQNHINNMKWLEDYNKVFYTHLKNYIWGYINESFKLNK